MRLSCLARNGRSPGEESLTAAVAAQAIEAQPSFGQIKPSEAAWRRSGSPEEKTWRILSEPHKRPGSPGEEKENAACRWARPQRAWNRVAHRLHLGCVACVRHRVGQSAGCIYRAVVMRWTKKRSARHSSLKRRTARSALSGLRADRTR